jgi:hypothetical protein
LDVLDNSRIVAVEDPQLTLGGATIRTRDIKILSQGQVYVVEITTVPALATS